MTSTLDSKTFQHFIEHDNHEFRENWKEVGKDEIFIPRYDLSLREQKELAMERLRVAAKNHLFSVFDFQINPMKVFAAHEMAALIEGSFATKLTVQLNLFGGTLLTLGSERHQHLFNGVNDLSVVGCFALTELGYGNNAVKMETTATFDKSTDSFIIHSPSVLSQKYWITHGALHCNWAIVFAQLIYNGKNEGVHTFLVKMRNEDGTVCNGIFIEDMGAKMGANGVDNGRIRFSNVKIPRENLLNKFSDIDSNGIFSSQISKKRDRFLRVADRLLSGRICISSMMISATKMALTVCLRYGAVRLGVAEDGNSGQPIMNFSLFKNALYPLLSKSIILNISYNKIKEIYSQALLSNQATQPQIVILCCVIKPAITWNFNEVARTTIERCGGQGYLACNRLAEGAAFSHSGITAEGDNSVLMMKAAKELMTLVAKADEGILECKMKNSKESLFAMTQFRCPFMLLDLLKYKEKIAKDALTDNTKSKMGEGKSIYQIWMIEDNELVQEVSKSFSDRIVAQYALDEIIKAPQSIQQALLTFYFTFVTSCILTNLHLYLTHGFIGGAGVEYLKSSFKILLEDVHKISLQTANSFGIPEHLLTAPIAQDYVAFNNGPNKGEVFKSKL